MLTVLINLSKYVLMFLILFYTLICFWINAVKETKAQSRLLTAQKIIMTAVFVISYLLIFYYAYSFLTLILFMLELLYLLVFPALFNTVYQHASGVITNNMTFMLSIGFIMITRLSASKSLKQFIIVIIGSVLFFFAPLIICRKKFILKSGVFFSILGLLLLGITLVLGKTSFGANLSYTIAGITFQPSEFVKILFVLSVAAMLQKADSISKLIFTGIISGLHVLILVMSSDLGTALILFVVYLIMAYIFTGRFIVLAGGLMLGSAASVLAYKIFSHVRVRVSAFLNPWVDIDNKGYQITQSLFAIGTGGIFGMGLYQGLPESIPVVEKDFIFSAISEEYGMIFAICLILICMSTFLEIMKISAGCKDRLYKLISSGFGVLYIFQCFMTIGGAIKFIPSTGVTFPFISYGGSSILSSLLMFSIIQTVKIRQEADNEKKQS